LKKQGYRTNF